jgi:large subunit ribosomal protein L18e
MAKINHKNNELAGLVAELKKLSIEKKVNIWKRLAEDLEKPTRSRRIVNIYKLDKYTKNDEFVVVPGKVLGTGDLGHSVNVAAYSFSEDALKKISEKGKALSIKDVMKSNPEGKNIRIIG